MANAISTEFLGVQGLLDYFGDLGDKGKVETKREVKRTASLVLNGTRRLVKKHFDTGALYNSYSADSNDGWATAEVGSTAEHAIFLEVGTKAHPIPKIGPLQQHKFLVFFWEKTGGMVFAKRVQHPGTPAHPYLLQSFLKNTATFGNRLAGRFTKLMKK